MATKKPPKWERYEDRLQGEYFGKMLQGLDSGKMSGTVCVERASNGKLLLAKLSALFDITRAAPSYEKLKRRVDEPGQYQFGYGRQWPDLCAEWQEFLALPVGDRLYLTALLDDSESPGQEGRILLNGARSHYAILDRQNLQFLDCDEAVLWSYRYWLTEYEGQGIVRVSDENGRALAFIRPKAGAKDGRHPGVWLIPISNLLWTPSSDEPTEKGA